MKCELQIGYTSLINKKCSLSNSIKK